MREVLVVNAIVRKRSNVALVDVENKFSAAVAFQGAAACFFAGACGVAEV